MAMVFQEVPPPIARRAPQWPRSSALAVLRGAAMLAVATSCEGFCTASGTGKSAGSAPLTLLPQDRGDESPACLDGSPYGFYFVPSKAGSTKWTINIDGGGWCYDEVQCHARSMTRMGSSRLWPNASGCGCMNTLEDGLDGDCNCLHMPYGDGASFSGYRAKPWPVPNIPNATLTFRGITNLDATLDWALAHGLDEATELVLTGFSAGGLATFLHADRVAARVRKGAPNIKKIRAAPNRGFFLDHDNFGHMSGIPNTPSWKHSRYTDQMKYVYHMQNLTFGPDGGLTEECREEQVRAGSDPALCVMAPHMQGTIRTPFFVFNSKYDSWQLDNVLQAKRAGRAGRDAVVRYGADFMRQLAPATASPKNGAFITSCVCHPQCPFDQLAIEGRTAFQHYAAWMAGNTTGAASVHVDARPPNGGGELTHPGCVRFPQEDGLNLV